MKLNVVGTIIFKRPRIYQYTRKHGMLKGTRNTTLGELIVIETEDGRKLSWNSSYMRTDLNVGDEIEATFNLRMQHYNNWCFIKNPRKLRVLETVQQKVWKAKTPQAKDKLLNMFVQKENPIRYTLDASIHPEDEKLRVARIAAAQLSDSQLEFDYVDTTTL